MEIAGLVMLVMGHSETWGSSQMGPGLEGKSDPSPFGDLPSIKLMLMQST